MGLSGQRRVKIYNYGGPLSARGGGGAQAASQRPRKLRGDTIVLLLHTYRLFYSHLKTLTAKHETMLRQKKKSRGSINASFKLQVKLFHTLGVIKKKRKKNHGGAQWGK